MKEKIEEIKDYYRESIKWVDLRRPSNGGQTAGIQTPTMRLECSELLFAVEIGDSVSQIKNRDKALLLFELYLSDIVK